MSEFIPPPPLYLKNMAFYVFSDAGQLESFGIFSWGNSRPCTQHVKRMKTLSDTCPYI